MRHPKAAQTPTYAGLVSGAASCHHNHPSGNGCVDISARVSPSSCMMVNWLVMILQAAYVFKPSPLAKAVMFRIAPAANLSIESVPVRSNVSSNI